jgi:hypothetical protein
MPVLCLIDQGVVATKKAIVCPLTLTLGRRSQKWYVATSSSDAAYVYGVSQNYLKRIASYGPDKQ